MWVFSLSLWPCALLVLISRACLGKQFPCRTHHGLCCFLQLTLAVLPPFPSRPVLAQGRVFRLLAQWPLHDCCSVTWQHHSPSARHQMLPCWENKNLKLFLAESAAPWQHWTNRFWYPTPPCPSHLCFLDWRWKVAICISSGKQNFSSDFPLAFCNGYFIWKLTIIYRCALEFRQT